MSSITKGYTREEIREVVHDYYLQPHGTRQAHHSLKTVRRLRDFLAAVLVRSART